MKKISLLQLRRMILEEANISKAKPKNRRSLASMLFEEDDALEVPNFTVVALYGPPAAGKGAAKDFVKSEFGGKEQSSTVDDYIDGLPEDAQKAARSEIKGIIEKEEDAWMTGITTGRFPGAVFLDLHTNAQMDPAKWDSLGKEYWHKNETGQGGPVTDLIDGKTYVKIMEENNGDVKAAAEQFAKFPETQSWFAQARGFSKAPPGMEDLEDYMGEDENGLTLKLRNEAKNSYIKQVRGSIEQMMGNSQKFGNLFLADQAGESTTNIDRISDLGELRDKGVRVIGVYIHQPAARTTIANLHRKSMDTGGRRVAQSEVDAIAQAGPEFDDSGNITKRGAAIDAMDAAGFDGIYVYHPGKSFDYGKTTKGITKTGEIGDVPIASAICEPFGDGTGTLDIEGCDDEKVHPSPSGPKVSAGSLRGLESKIVKKAAVGDEEGTGYLPDWGTLSQNDQDVKAVLDAISGYGFRGVNSSHLESYLSLYAPGGAQRSPKYGEKKDFGNNPYGKELFGDMNPDKQVVIKGVKSECILAKRTDDLILERWQRLAGIL